MWSTRRNSCAGGDRRRKGIHRRRNRRGRWRGYRRRGPGGLFGGGRGRGEGGWGGGGWGIGGRRGRGKDTKTCGPVGEERTWVSPKVGIEIEMRRSKMEK